MKNAHGVELNDIKPGDTIYVSLTVTDADHDRIEAKMVSGYGVVGVPVGDVRGHKGREIKVGDHVLFGSQKERMCVLARHGSEVWLLREDGSMTPEYVSDLHHAPEVK